MFACIRRQVNKELKEFSAKQSDKCRAQDVCFSAPKSPNQRVYEEKRCCPGLPELPVSLSTKSKHSLRKLNYI